MIKMRRSAEISPDGRYRYRLDRWWSEKPSLVVCMLNPSTADAMLDDPTIRRCVRFAEREGCGGLKVVNLMAFRATDPKICLAQEDPYGPLNDSYLEDAIRTSGIGVVCAWGTKAPREAVDRAMEIFKAGYLRCFGRTKEGHPRHPLYLRSEELLIPFTGGV